MVWEATEQRIVVLPGFWYKVDKEGIVYKKKENRGRKKLGLPIRDENEEFL